MLADVTSAKDTQAYVDATVARWGPIDVLFSNAGISGVIRPVTDYPEDVFDAVVAVNLKGSFLACKHALPKMRDGGSIIMTSSVVGVTSDPGIAAYAASKHGLIGLMRTVAKEAASRRIRVNVVAPGPIDNDFQRNVESGLEPGAGHRRGQVPRFGDPARPSRQGGGGGRDGAVPRLGQERLHHRQRADGRRRHAHLKQSKRRKGWNSGAT